MDELDSLLSELEAPAKKTTPPPAAKKAAAPAPKGGDDLDDLLNDLTKPPAKAASAAPPAAKKAAAAPPADDLDSLLSDLTASPAPKPAAAAPAKTASPAPAAKKTAAPSRTSTGPLGRPCIFFFPRTDPKFETAPRMNWPFPLIFCAQTLGICAVSVDCFLDLLRRGLYVVSASFSCGGGVFHGSAFFSPCHGSIHLHLLSFNMNLFFL
jgi:hypothetical protein